MAFFAFFIVTNPFILDNVQLEKRSKAHTIALNSEMFCFISRQGDYCATGVVKGLASALFQWVSSI